MKERLDYITNLRFPLIVGVVLDHASVVMPASVRGEGTASLLFSMLQTVVKISVPVFFIISGYLFFRGVESFGKTLYEKKLRSRVHTLLIPYVLWTLICLLYMLTKHLPAIIHAHSLDAVSDLFSWRIFWMYKEGLPLHFPLWYVRDLMLMCLFSPIVWFLISRLRHIAMLVIWLLFMVHDIDSSLSFPISIFYFSLGSYFAICSIDIQRIARSLGWGILLVAAVAVVCSVWGIIPLTRFSHITFALCCLGLSSFLTGRYQCKVPALLTDSVFFVYVTHTIMVVMAFNKVFMPIIPDGAHPALLFLRMFIVGIMTLLTCVLLFVTLRRFIPKTMSILTGSR